MLTAANAVIYGTVYASKGEIAGFAIKKNMLSYGGDNLAASLFICPDGKSSEGEYMNTTIGDYLIEDVVLKISENFAIGKNGKVAVGVLGCEELSTRTLVLSKDGKIDFRGTVTDKALGIYTGWEETLKTAGITGNFNLVENVTVGSEDLNAGEYQVENVMKYLLSGEDISFSFLSRIQRIEKRMGISESYIDAGLPLDSLYASKSHTHSDYASTSHTHSNYALTSHTHSNYALTSHTHSNYALTNHNHDTVYAKLSGATFSGTVQSTYFRAGDKYIEATSGATIGNSGYAAFGQTVTCKVLVQKSDRRLKNTIAELDHSFDEFFRKLKPVTFKFNDKKEFSFGFIAQDVQKALAESGHDIEQFDIVQKSKDVYYSINHAQITALNTHMIQIALNENAELKKRISQLEEKILELTA